MRNSLRCSSEIPQVLFRTCKNAGVETVSVTNKHLRLLYGRQFTLKRCSYCERFTLLGNELQEKCCFVTDLVGGVVEDVSASSSCQTRRPTSWTHSFILRLLISCV